MPRSERPRLRAALMLIEVGLPILPAHYPVLAGYGMTGCTCGEPSCLMAGRHLIDDLSPDDASTDPQQITRWWTGGMDWNLATVTGQAVDVVELACPSPSSEVAAWLHGHEIEPGPVIEAGSHVQFLTTVSPEAGASFAPLTRGWIGRLAYGAMVLLPPSRLPAGLEVQWLTGPAMALPDGRRLFEALRALPATCELSE